MFAYADCKVTNYAAVHFCDPRSPSDRCINPKTIRVARQYLPRGHDLSTLTDRGPGPIAAEVNNRARESLGWMTPTEKCNELLAMAG